MKEGTERGLSICHTSVHLRVGSHACLCIQLHQARTGGRVSGHRYSTLEPCSPDGGHAGFGKMNSSACKQDIPEQHGD